ncbi:hypothetical protein COCOBI_pt-2130 (chloroplast) [Coccomyxa sp. Obi]|nr:hypothetical protein COCOBI_pt-2130 [Coccomyxa sp. Obi]
MQSMNAKHESGKIPTQIWQSAAKPGRAKVPRNVQRLVRESQQ